VTCTVVDTDIAAPLGSTAKNVAEYGPVGTLKMATETVEFLLTATFVDVPTFTKIV
jgi:hypothetical protein